MNVTDRLVISSYIGWWYSPGADDKLQWQHSTLLREVKKRLQYIYLMQNSFLIMCQYGEKKALLQGQVDDVGKYHGDKVRSGFCVRYI